MKKLLVEGLIGLFGARRHEDVAPNELVYDFTIGRQTAENDVPFFELNHHVFHFPVHVPSLELLLGLQILRIKNDMFTYFHGVVSPRLQMIASIKIHLHQAIVCNTQ